MSTDGRKTEESKAATAVDATGVAVAATAATSAEGVVTLPYASDETTEAAKRGPDVSGRDRMAWNVFTSWAGYIVFIVAGFVLPRFIDRHVSQAGLGVWDYLRHEAGTHVLRSLGGVPDYNAWVRVEIPGRTGP